MYKRQYLNKAEQKLNQVQGTLYIEAQNYLIRVYKGQSEKEKAKNAYQNCMRNAPEHIMSHLNYLDTILPKWLGSREETDAFIESNRSKNKLLVYLLEGKRVLEYFSEDEDTSICQEYINQYEPQISQLKSDNPNRFILFNYVYFFADEVGNTSLEKKYLKKVKEFYATSIYGPLRSKKEIKKRLN